MCMLRSCLLASQWDEGREEEEEEEEKGKGQCDERDVGSTISTLKQPAGVWREMRGMRGSRRSECGYEDEYEYGGERKRWGCCLRGASKTSKCQDACLLRGNLDTHLQKTSD